MSCFKAVGNTSDPRMFDLWGVDDRIAMLACKLTKFKFDAMAMQLVFLAHTRLKSVYQS